MLKHTLLTFILFTKSNSAATWQNEWTTLTQEKALILNSAALFTSHITGDDLKILDCMNFNNFSKEKKAIFWSLIIKSLAKAESNFHPIAKSIGKKSGFGNYGLLQISKRTARTLCGLERREDLFDPEKNLECGLHLLEYQLNGGAKDPSKKKTRPDAVGRIFTSPIFFWGPLRAHDFKGRKRFLSTFQNDPNFTICQN